MTNSDAMRRTATTAHLVLIALFLAGVVAQVFLAGLGIFGARSFAAHQDLGSLLQGATVLILAAAAVGPRTRGEVLHAAGLLVLTTGQVGLAGARDDAPGLAALHPTLALAVFLLAYVMLRRALVQAAAPA